MGRDIIAPMKSLGATPGFIVGALENGLTLDQARSTWNTSRRGGGAEAFLSLADQIGLSQRQARLMADAMNITVSARDLRYLGHAPAWRDPEQAWDSGTGQPIAQCKRFFGAHRNAFLAWANAEEDDGRDWRESAMEMRTVR